MDIDNYLFDKSIERYNTLQFINENEYLKDNFNNLSRNEYYIYDYISEMRNFFCNNIPVKFLENINNRIYSDYVLETLNTHDYKLLQQKLYDKFNNLISTFEDVKGENNKASFYIICNNYNNLKTLYKDTEFNNLLSFFNYICKPDINKLFIEPRYSTNVTNYIYNECKGIVYHVTKKKYVNDILAKGIRVRNNTYKNKDRKIFCIATEKLNLNKLESEYLENMCKDILMTTTLSECAILKINLKSLKPNINFYEDTAMEGYKNTFFTFSNIPYFCITDITEKIDILKHC